MFKKIAISTLLCNSLLLSDDVLTGDTRLACETILCLSSSTQPAECSPSLNRYFSIKFKKPSDTIDARRAFLQLCPVASGNIEDLVFKNLVVEVLPVSDPRECTPEYLNKQIDTRIYEIYDNDGNTYLAREHRINPTLPSQCNALFAHAYTDHKKPQYICSGAFINESAWKAGITTQSISVIEYNKLSAQEKAQYKKVGSRLKVTYQKSTPINKNCWVTQ